VYALSTFAVNVTPFPLPGALFGCTMSTAGSSATLSVAAGFAADSTNTTIMKLAASLAKTTASWVAGAGGALDTGTIANATWYHWFVIMNPTTLAVDILCSANLTPTLPGGFTLFRRIGSAKTDGSAHWQAFVQNGDTFVWTGVGGYADYSAYTGIGGGVSVAVPLASVPPSVSVKAAFHFAFGNTTAGTTIVLASGLAGAAYASPAGSASQIAVVANQLYFSEITLDTNTSGQIYALGPNGTTIYIIVTGWTDTRGRLG
jgi:hypothetical protein